MINTPAERTQVDGLQNEYSELAQLDTSNLPDLTRQEFRTETDVNYILSRFGVGVPQRNVNFGEVNFDMDLQQAMTVMDDARRVHAAMPADLKKAYPTPAAMLNALADGSMTKTISDLQEAAAAQKRADEQRAKDQRDLEAFRKGQPKPSSTEDTTEPT